MSPKFEELIERARNHNMTPAERFEQRVSFVYGQQDWDSACQRSKNEIREHLRSLGYGPGA
jgi:hypothetical protein